MTPPSSRRFAATVAAALTSSVLLIPLWLAGSAPAGAQPGATTTTLPVDNRQFGDIIPEPNSGREPTSPGDPGGWMQAMMFFLICAAVLVIIGVVWYLSRRARDRRRAAGLDPIELARRSGAGVRAPRPTSGTPAEDPK